MKYLDELVYAYGKDVVKGGVEIWFMKPANSVDEEYISDMTEKELERAKAEWEELSHYKYVLLDPFTGEKMWSRRFKTQKEARIEGIYKLNDLWELLDEGIKADDEKYIEFKKQVKRLF